MSKRQKRNPSPFQELRRYGGWLEICAENQVTRDTLSIRGRDALHFAEELHKKRQGDFSDFVKFARQNPQSYKYLCADVWPEILLLHSNVESAFYVVCDRGYTKSAQWLIEHWRLDDQLTVCRKGFILACKTGQLELAKQLHAYFPTVMRKANEIFPTICANGHLNVVQWLRPRVSPKTQLAGFGYACQRNRKRVAEHLRQVTDVNDTWWQYAFMSACNEGHLNIVKWIYECQTIVIRPAITAGMVYAVKSNHLSVLKWLHTLRATPKNTDIYNMYDSACALNYPEIVYFLLKTFPTKLPSEHEKGFELACRYGHLDLAKRLLIEQDYVTDEELDTVFRETCARGQLNVAKWLFQTFEWRVAGEQTLDFAFRKACGNGHLDVAKWLVSTWPDINVTSLDMQALCLACKNAHLDVVRWISTLNVQHKNNHGSVDNPYAKQPIEYWFYSCLKRK